MVTPADIVVAAPVAPPPPPDRVLNESAPFPSVTRAWSSSPSDVGNLNPDIVDIPVEYMFACIALLLKVAIPTLFKLSISVLPSTNKCLHSLSDAPKSLTLSVLGRRLLSNLPVTVIVSLVASPRSTFPVTLNPVHVTTPDKFAPAPVIPAL